MAGSIKGNGGRAKWLTLAAMTLGYGVVQPDVTIVNVNVAIASIGQSERWPEARAGSFPGCAQP